MPKMFDMFSVQTFRANNQSYSYLKFKCTFIFHSTAIPSVIYCFIETFEVSHDFNACIVSFRNNSIFYNSYIKCIEQGVFEVERITFSRYYVVNLEKCEIVIKLLESNCKFL